MSIHARLNPEAQANLEAQRKASVITSLIIAILSVAVSYTHLTLPTNREV